ncbi:MAG: hypothetical protein A4E59_00430 [Syntrophorhabdus sp. PtaB.Bin027]|jgi:hypothetical protein|nr:MAG: hypothetical protein A4E59_00430 [Syntrophorhabdus sp. PtaB.Bin027]
MDDCELDFEEESEEQSDAEITLKQVSDAVVYNTDWTTETIISQFSRGNINLYPHFQRRDAWTIIKKSRFIESILLGLPLPQIVLAENRNERGKYLVLDGKQRMLSLLQFMGLIEGKNNLFNLRGLEILKNLNGLNFKDIERSPDFRDELNQFYNQTIRSVVIRNWPNEGFLHLVFIRLNTGSVQLSPQELRQALFPGKFVDFIEDISYSNKNLQILLRISEPDFRMRDVEILLRYFAFSFFISNYAGNLQIFLDNTCDYLNKNWEANEENIKLRAEEFDKSIEASIEIFGAGRVARKWTKNGLEAKLNRAVLDSISFYFSDDIIRKAALNNAKAIEEAFKSLCLESEEFRTSIGATTKSLGATSSRFILWGQKLREVLELDFRIPTFDSGRIKFSGFWKQENE